MSIQSTDIVNCHLCSILTYPSFSFQQKLPAPRDWQEQDLKKYNHIVFSVCKYLCIQITHNPDHAVLILDHDKQNPHFEWYYWRHNPNGPYCGAGRRDSVSLERYQAFIWASKKFDPFFVQHTYQISSKIISHFLWTFLIK